MSVATWIQSLASAAHSHSFRGTGIAVTVASFAWWQSLILHKIIASNAGITTNAGQTLC